MSEKLKGKTTTVNKKIVLEMQFSPEYLVVLYIAVLLTVLVSVLAWSAADKPQSKIRKFGPIIDKTFSEPVTLM